MILIFFVIIDLEVKMENILRFDGFFTKYQYLCSMLAGICLFII
jgi:hypothetical protein